MMTRLEEVRKRRGLTQMDLARRMRPPIHPSAVSAVERGRLRPWPSFLRRAARVLGVTVEDLNGETAGGEVQHGDLVSV